MESEHVFAVRRGTLVVLCGISGCGKSSLAARNFVPTQIVSSDECRALISDNPANQWASGRAFALLHFLVDQRLGFKRTTVVDSTALTRSARTALLKIARRNRARTMLVCLDMPIEVCLQRDAERERMVGEEVIRRQAEQFEHALRDVQDEAWDQIVVLSAEEIEQARFAA